MFDSVQPHRWQPTRLPRPWDSPAKNTGVGFHFLLQFMKVKSLSRVRLLATPWTAAYQASSSMGFSRQECWSGVPLPLCQESLEQDKLGTKTSVQKHGQDWIGFILGTARTITMSSESFTLCFGPDLLTHRKTVKPLQNYIPNLLILLTCSFFGHSKGKVRWGEEE